MPSRGAVTPMITIVITLMLLMGGVILDIGESLSRERTFERESYLMLHSRMKAYDRTLFNRFGIMAIKSREDGFSYEDSLGESAVLGDKLVEVMGYRAGGDLSREILGLTEGASEIAGIIKEVKHIMDLKNTINAGIENGQIPEERIIMDFLDSFLLVAMFFEGSPPTLEAILEGELVEIHLREEFVTIFDTFSGLSSNSLLLKFLSPFLLGEYVVDYLGYSSNRNPVNAYGAEYVLTGIGYSAVSRPAVMAELGGLRLILNTVAYLKSPRHMKNFATQAGPDPRAQIALLLLTALKTSAFDVNRLYEGGRVPLLKTAAELDQSRFKRGILYADYLKILLITLPEFLILNRIKTAMAHHLGESPSRYFTRLTIRRDFSYEFKTFDYSRHDSRTFEASY